MSARIVGPRGETMPADGKAVGELDVRGPWVTAGYVGEADPDPDKFRDGWLRTGDVGTLSPDGFLTLTTGPKTSSSPAVSGSLRSSWRTR